VYIRIFFILIVLFFHTDLLLASIVDYHNTIYTKTGKIVKHNDRWGLVLGKEYKLQALTVDEEKGYISYAYLQSDKKTTKTFMLFPNNLGNEYLVETSNSSDYSNYLKAYKIIKKTQLNNVYDRAMSYQAENKIIYTQLLDVTDEVIPQQAGNIMAYNRLQEITDEIIPDVGHNMLFGKEYKNHGWMGLERAYKRINMSGVTKHSELEKIYAMGLDSAIALEYRIIETNGNIEVRPIFTDSLQNAYTSGFARREKAQYANLKLYEKGKAILKWNSDKENFTVASLIEPPRPKPQAKSKNTKNVKNTKNTKDTKKQAEPQGKSKSNSKK
jgi:hypothetical protein